MLVLTRKKGQSIFIGDKIEVSVERVDGESVRIGIRAPKDIPIYRREVFEAIRQENILAAREALKIAGKLKKVRQPGGNERQGSKKDGSEK